MAASLSSLLSFNSKNLQASIRHQRESRRSARVSAPDKIQLPSLGWWSVPQRRRKLFRVSASDGDRLAIDTADKGSSATSESVDRGTQSNGSIPKQEAESARPPETLGLAPKRSPLTARERLRAARVLSRYTETKPAPKSQLGSKVLDALKESDGGKRKSGLPEAPSNMFDDSKRGLPKEGWTFDFPGGFDLFVVILSFVTISTIMFATTYLVWKVGAIHFNEF